MKSHLIPIYCFLTSIGSFAQVTESSSGRVNLINADFSFTLNDGQFNRPIIKTGWLTGIGDYVYLKNGGNNTEVNTYGLRISDGLGLDFGRNEFASSLFKIGTNGNVGIGTTSPASKLDVNGAIRAQESLTVNTNGSYKVALNGQADGYIAGRDNSYATKFRISSNGTSYFNGGNVGIGTTSPASKLDVNGAIRAQEFLTVNTNGSYKVALNGQADGYIAGRDNSYATKFIISSNGTSYFNGGNVGIGTSDPGSWKLAVKGKIRAEEIKVETGWADYVFKEDYDLPSLKEVEKHIHEKGHLINIPSANEVAENGILLGEMNKLLLEKIEELVLYTIQQQKDIESLKFQNQKYKKLELRLKTIENLLITK
jgi:ribosomal protein L27